MARRMFARAPGFCPLSRREALVFEENISKGKMLVIAFQRVLTMTPGAIAVPLLLASGLGLDAQTTSFLVAANFFTSGITTLLQVIGIGKLIGSRYPIILGSSFAPLAPMIMIGTRYGLPTLFGSIIASGAIIFLLSFFMDKVMKLFPQVVVGAFVTLIGVSLAPSALRDLAGGEGSAAFASVPSLALGFGVLVFVLLVERYGKGIWRSMSLLLGIVFGTVVGAFLGMVDPAPVLEAAPFQAVAPFAFGMPEFHIVPILFMVVFCVINTLQCIGVYSVVDEITGTTSTPQIESRGIRAQALGQMVSGAFNSIPSTMFNENAGLVDLTRIKDRKVFIAAGIMLIIVGVCPPIAAAIVAVPKCVLGGATMALFGIITSSGISILSRLDFGKNNNFKIVGTSIAIGVGSLYASEVYANLPEAISMVMSNGLFMVTLSAVVLNLLLNGKKALSVDE